MAILTGRLFGGDMAWKYLVIDDATGRKARGGLAVGVGPLFVVEKFLVTNALGQITFALSTNITDLQLIDVLVNGTELDEGDDFVRDADANTIIFNYTIPKNAKVKIKIYS